MTYIEHLDDKFDFGKFTGCTFAEVVEFNPEYISWVVENVSGSMCVFCDSAIEELRLIFPRFEISSSFEAMRNLRIAEFEDLEDEIINKIRKTPYWEDFSTNQKEKMISSYFDARIQKNKYSKIVYSENDKIQFVENVLTLSNNR
mgnify:CR=1 FL=1